MTALAAASFPHTLTAPNMVVTLAADGTYGCKMTQVNHTEGGSFVWATAEPGSGTSYVDQMFDGSLWRLEVNSLDATITNNPLTMPSAITASIGPEDAAEFQAFDVASLTGTTDAILLEWRRISVAGYRDEFWVRVLIDLENGSARKVRFRGWFGRHRGGELTVDRFVLPCLCIDNPTAPRATEGYTEASRRTRVLIPNSIYLSSPLNLGMNTPLSAWALQGSLGYQFTHPNPLQPIPFFAIAAMDAQDTASYRRMLHVQAEDANFYHKQFAYKMMHDAGLTQRMLGAAHGFIPSYTSLAGKLDTDGFPPESWLRNEWETPYSVTLEALTASTDSFWYDSCVKYRDWAIPAIAPSRRYSSTILNPVGKSPVVLLAVNTFDITNYNGDVLADSIVDACERLLNGMRLGTPTIEPLRAVLEVQCPNEYGQSISVPHSGIEGPGSPSPHITKAMKSIYPRLAAIGLEVLAIYIRPGDMPSTQSYGPLFSWGFAALNRKGVIPVAVATNPDGSVASTSTQMDLANPGYQKFFGKEAVAAALCFDFQGLYLDTFLGVYRSFPRRINGHRSHVAQGGNYQKAAIDAILADIRLHGSKWTANENADEQFLGQVDFTQPDYTWLSNRLFLAERACDLGQILYGVPLTSTINEADYPVAAREINPPIWAAIWNAYQPSMRLIRPMSDLPLSTSALHPGPSSEPGLSQAQFFDMELWQRMTVLVSGQQPTFFDFYVDDNLNVLDWVADPGKTLWDLFKVFYDFHKSDHAGPYLINGDMQRPLVVDLLGTDVTRATNPLYTAAQNVNLQATRPDDDFPYRTDTIGTLIDVTSAGNEIRNFEVPQILHSVWKDPVSGRIGIILANWSSNASAKFLGSYNPALYGSVTGDVRVWTLGDPSTSAVVDTVVGTHTFGVGAVTADTVISVGARSIVLVTIG